MPLSTPTLPVGPTQVSNNQVNVFLAAYSRLANIAPKVGLEIAWMNFIQGSKNTFTRRINERSRLSGVATFSVGDNAPEARATLTPATITAALRGLMTYLRDDAVFVSFENELLANQDQLLAAYAQYWHEQVLDLFASISASSGNASTVLDLETWDTWMGLISDDNWPTEGSRWVVCHGDGIRDLKASLRAAGGSVYATAFGERKAQVLGSTDSRLGVPFEDVMLYRSNDVPVGDTTGWTAAAGIKVDSQDNRALDSALAVDIHVVSSVEYQRDAPSVGQVQVVSGIAGCGIQTQGTCRALVHRT